MKFLVIIFLWFSSLAYAQNLTVGWATKEPYQQGTQEGLTGLDIQLIRHIFEHAGLRSKFLHVDAEKQLEELKQNKIQVMVSPLRQEVDETYKYSKPYRHEKQGLFYIKDLPPKPRIGISRLSLLPDLDILDDAQEIKEYESIDQLFEALQQSAIDGFIIDQIAGATFIWKNGLSNLVKHKTLEQTLPVYLIFNASVSDGTISRIDEAITSFNQTKQYSEIYRKYYQPILLSQTINQSWFFIIDIIGTIAFALSGVIIAYRERMTVFGAFVMAVFPATGGGTIRDLIVGRSPVFLVGDPSYLYAIIAAVVSGLIFIKFFAYHEKVPKKLLKLALEIFDALGLSCFTVIGVWVAFMKNAEPLWLWGPLLGVLTATGGGIIRDLFRSDNYYTSLKGGVYPEIAIFWASCLTFFMLWYRDQLTFEQVFWAIVICMIGGFVTRLYVYKKGWKNPALKCDRQ